MKNEYKYLLILGGWIALWSFLPWVALPLFIIVAARQFMAYRKQRKQNEVAKNIDRERWAKMEGFYECEQVADPADWWKR